MKKAFIIHRWSGKPDSDWYPWLKKELEEKGFSVEVPEMPDTDTPKINSWVNKLKEIAPNLDEEMLLVGHSIGCQTILRYLESISEKSKAGKIVFVAPWIHLNGIEEEGPESVEIAKPWLETPINFEKARTHFDSMTCIFSDNDLYVPLSDINIFRELLKAEVITEHRKGHFTEDDEVKELPSLIEKLSALSA